MPSGMHLVIVEVVSNVARVWIDRAAFLEGALFAVRLGRAANHCNDNCVQRLDSVKRFWRCLAPSLVVP